MWSRPNAFAEGVPFRFPASPDTGAGLTAAGRELVRACNRLGILVDLSHLNEAGFWDVAALSDAPLVATHSNAHALCAASRNLLDPQLDAIRDSDGIVGVNFAVTFLREDGLLVPETPITEIVRHVDYLVERMGIDHVAFGSDFDGAVMPQELGGVAGLPKLVDGAAGGRLRRRGRGEDHARELAARPPRDVALSLPVSDASVSPSAREEAARVELITSTPSWLNTSFAVKTVPRRGSFDDGCTSTTVERPVSVSPGRTGAVQRISSTPGEPSEAESSSTPRTNIPMNRAVVCQPLAIRPPNGDSLAASASMWNGCGSKRVANSTISSSVTVTGPTSADLADLEVLPVAHDPHAIATFLACAHGTSAD